MSKQKYIYNCVGTVDGWRLVSAQITATGKVAAKKKMRRRFKGVKHITASDDFIVI